MNNSRPRFSFFTRLTTWMFLVGFAFLPLGVVLQMSVHNPVTITAGIKSVLWAATTCGMFIYARHRCGSDRLVFEDGLYFVAHSTQVWGMGASFLLIAPALCLTLLASVAVAAFNDLTGKAVQSPATFYRLIGLAYKNRLFR